MKPVTGRVPDKLYRQFHKYLPVACVDVVIKSGSQFFLVRRNNQPERGKWWLPGGRLFKNERLAAAARRKVRQETGFSARRLRFLGVYEYFSRTGYFPGVSAHCLAMVYLAEVSVPGRARLDAQSSEGRWFSRIEPAFHPYLKEYLKKAGLR